MLGEVLHLLGETMREVGILILVFAPLEFYLRGTGASLIDVRLPVAGSLILIAAGISLDVAVERKR